MGNRIFGLEIIANQNSDTFNKLTSIVDDYRNKRFDSDGFCQLMADTLEKRYGLSIDFGIENSLFISAYVKPNIYVKTHPLYNDYNADIARGMKLVGMNDIITANIDLKKAYISGSIQKYPTKMRVTSTLLDKRDKDKYQISNEEVAAIVLHEMGHVFTFVEYMLYSTKMCVVIDTVTQDLVGQPEDKRLKIINKNSDLKSLSSKEKYDLATADNKESIEVVILKGMIEDIDASVGMNYYSTRYFEQTADLFAMRNGAGKYLVSGLAKTIGRNDIQKEVLITEAILSVVTLAIPLIVVTLLTLSDRGKMYDSSDQRFRFIREQYVSQLKDATTTDEKKRILLIIKEIDECIAYVRKEPIHLTEYLSYALSSRYRSVQKQEKTMKEIESMINNDLYVASSTMEVNR